MTMNIFALCQEIIILRIICMYVMHAYNIYHKPMYIYTQNKNRDKTVLAQAKWAQ